MTRCTFLQVTDHHLREHAREEDEGRFTADALDAALAHLAAHDLADADFVLSSGDVVERPTEGAYAHARARFAALGDAPLRVVPGNHDDRDLFRRHFLADVEPGARLHQVFEHGGVRFAALDWGLGGRGESEPGLWRALDEALGAGRPTVILTHHHLVPCGIPWIDTQLPADVDRFRARLRDAAARGTPVLGVFSGHTHRSYEAAIDGVPVYGLRATAPQFAVAPEPRVVREPPQYRRVDIRDGVLTTRLVEVPR